MQSPQREQRRGSGPPLRRGCTRSVQTSPHGCSALQEQRPACHRTGSDQNCPSRPHRAPSQAAAPSSSPCGQQKRHQRRSPNRNSSKSTVPGRTRRSKSSLPGPSRAAIKGARDSVPGKDSAVRAGYPQRTSPNPSASTTVRLTSSVRPATDPLRAVFLLNATTASENKP